MYKVQSFQISDTIDIKSFKNFFTAKLFYSDSDELYFQVSSDQYIYVFKYGVVCFMNQDDVRISDFIKLISPYCKNFFEVKSVSYTHLDVYKRQNVGRIDDRFWKQAI